MRSTSGDVGGASAGLPFALEVYQQLGKDVDRGYRIAATGEIQLDGSVAPVGGIKQKTVGVRRSGADVFLVPAGENASTARRYAGTLRVVPVESFRQALRVLQTLPRNSLFAGICLPTTPAICGDFVPEGVARRPGPWPQWPLF